MTDHDHPVLRFADFKPPTDRRAAVLCELTRLMALMPTEDLEALVGPYAEHVGVLTARGVWDDDGGPPNAG